ncbi:MAG: hypothetical protein L0212_09765 [Acidobacteria bacterium]|nr:hypothetical protein [Acidobacteriota bacterium]
MPPLGLTRILFVDGGAATSAEHGSLDHPYKKIQTAIGAVPIPDPLADSAVADSAEDWMILIAPGDYDESIEINGPVRLALIGLGAFRLGRYTAPGPTQPKRTNILAEAGATPRNVKWTYNQNEAIPGGAAPQLVIGMIGGTDVVRHGKPIANRISGSIFVEGSGWIGGDAGNVPEGGTAFLAIANTQVDAGITYDPDPDKRETPPTQPAIGATGFSGILVDRHFKSRFRGAILGHTLATSFMSQYEQLVQVSGYASIEQAAFAAGMTVSQVPNLGSLKSVVPPGMVNSTFAGTFTGPAGSLLLDAATNTWFIRNGATLAGGATKSFLGGASQTLAIKAAKVLKDSDCGVTLLANATGGPFSVTLPSAVGKDDLTFTIKNIGSANKATVTPAPSPPGQKIDGMNSLDLVPPPGAPSVINIVARDGQWWIVARG